MHRNWSRKLTVPMPKIPNFSSGDPLPLEYRWVRAHGLSALTPWYFIDDEKHRTVLRDYFCSESRGMDCWPFAFGDQRAEVAAFLLLEGRADGSVIVFDSHSESYSDQTGLAPLQTSRDFWEWFSDVMLPESKSCISEEELTDLLDEQN